MNFVYNNQVLSIQHENRPFLYNLRPYIMTEDGCKTHLPYVNSEKNCAYFCDKNLDAFVELTHREKLQQIQITRI